MADPTQNTAPAPVVGVEWDTPNTTQGGSPSPSPSSAPVPPASSSGAPVPTDGVEWDATQPNAQPAAPVDGGFLHGLYEHTLAPLVDTGKVLTGPAPNGEWAALKPVIQGTVKAQTDLAKQGVGEIKDAYNSRNAGSTAGERAATYYQGGAHLLESVLPGVGPQLAQTNEDLTERPDQGAGEAVGDIATALLPKVVEGAKTGVGKIIDSGADAPQRGFTAVLDQGKAGMGKNFDAEEVAKDISPIVQQELKSNPALRERIMDPKATPKESYEAFQEAIQNAQSHIDEAHLDALKNVKNQSVDVKPILNAIDEMKTEGMGKYAPEDAAELEALQRRIASVDTLGELNGLRMYLNNQTSPAFKMSGVAVQRSAMLDKAMSAAGSATRDAYYDGLSNATGQDFKTLKQTESNLLTAREALENAKGPLVSKEVQFNRPTTAKQKVGAVADAVTSLATGDKKKIASATLLESPMAQTHADIRRFVKTIPESVPGSYDSGARTPEVVTAQTTPNAAPQRPLYPKPGLPAGRKTLPSPTGQ